MTSNKETFSTRRRRKMYKNYIDILKSNKEIMQQIKQNFSENEYGNLKIKSNLKYEKNSVILK